MKDALDETLILSDKRVPPVKIDVTMLTVCSARIIQDLVSTIITDIGALYAASEAVALVDMLWSFAHVSIRMYSASCAT